MPTDPQLTPSSRDRSLRLTRTAAWLAGIVATALTAVFSVVSAHAFKGHDAKPRAPRPAPRARPAAPVRVPRAQHVPAIVATPAPLQGPESAPQPAPQPAPPPAPQPAPQPVPQPAPQPAPQTSGGS